MSILKRYTDAIDKKDEATMNELLHDDFKFTMHKSGNSLGKADVVKWAMSGDINQEKVRIIYENNEVGVHHSFLFFYYFHRLYWLMIIKKKLINYLFN